MSSIWAVGVLAGATLESVWSIQASSAPRASSLWVKIAATKGFSGAHRGCDAGLGLVVGKVDVDVNPVALRPGYVHLLE